MSYVREIYNGQIAQWRQSGNTLQEIANKVGVSRERIRQILTKHYNSSLYIPIPKEYVSANDICNLINRKKLYFFPY